MWDWLSSSQVAILAQQRIVCHPVSPTLSEHLHIKVSQRAGQTTGKGRFKKETSLQSSKSLASPACEAVWELLELKVKDMPTRCFTLTMRSTLKGSPPTSNGSKPGRGGRTQEGQFSHSQQFCPVEMQPDTKAWLGIISPILLTHVVPDS